MSGESLPSGVLKVAEECKRLLINFAESVWQAGKDGFRCDSIAYVREERAAVESAIDQLAALATQQPAKEKKQ